ncbi:MULTISPECIES: hypothetical protein [Niastella]|uniref:Uncharacterized protein n=1 Tax=Niastella soli TaxID=2821487 RepID=A0ABS3Z3V8_9BACT|nr:hypothetical protein [Niastella soli]MBO9204843.1 hypothetical protein [Niastella soli]
MKINPDNIVERIINLWDIGVDEEEKVIEIVQTEFQISEDYAESIFELIKIGLFRAQLKSTGAKYPKNNLDDDPYVRSALKIGLRNLGYKPWWKFW